ncbi:hypothetical protein DSO57_1016209 [Entomophthora muscae]|uniref:Uncharacterized protein n=1 Tax=Entomophthora muscae TaxID=34485 RepID=A0ACC2UQK8_9FUNG|nr:hypothetical protein DSO57_1016209 [Entomophthora muscae]
MTPPLILRPKHPQESVAASESTSTQIFGMICKDLAGFAFDFGNSLPSENGSGSISTHSGLLYLSVIDPGMNSSQHDPLSHSVFPMSDHHPFPII